MPACHLNLVQQVIKRVMQYCSKHGSIFLNDFKRKKNTSLSQCPVRKKKKIRKEKKRKEKQTKEMLHVLTRIPS